MDRAYYAVIPADVRYDSNISANAKLLYGEITALCNDKGYCWASNSYFAELYQTSNRTIQRWLENLRENGYIHVSSNRETSLRQIYLKRGDKNVTPPMTKMSPPHDKNVTHNNTKNNTVNNLSTTKELRNEDLAVCSQAYEANIGTISRTISDKILDALNNGLSAEIVIRAIEETAIQGVKSWNYTAKILERCKKENINSVEAYETDRKTKQPQKNNSIDVMEVLKDL